MYKEAARARRNYIAQKLQEGDICLSFGGNDELGIDQVPRHEDMDCNFFYLVGKDIPGGLLLMAKIRGAVQEILFVGRGTEQDEFYLGVSKDPAYYRNETGINNVMYIENFEDIIGSFTMMTRLNTVYFTSAFEKISKYPRYENLLAEKLMRAYPGIKIDSLSEEIFFMRLRKSDLEVAQIRKAVDITGKAIQKVAKALKPGMRDYQLQSIIRHEIEMEGGEGDIIQSLIGKDATIMHNFHPEGLAKDGDLFLADIVAFYNYYCCDISRTFPVNGKFTEEQAYWYNVCLKTQELVIENLAPGKLWADCGKEANEYFEGELRKHGYLGEQEDIRTLIGQCRINFATPGMVNHGIGLHHADKRQDEEGRIVPGMVFTVEPGVYLGEKGLGLRIEDNVLITETGYEVLSKDIPKTIDEIEAMMK